MTGMWLSRPTSFNDSLMYEVCEEVGGGGSPTSPGGGWGTYGCGYTRPRVSRVVLDQSNVNISTKVKTPTYVISATGPVALTVEVVLGPVLSLSISFQINCVTRC